MRDRTLLTVVAVLVLAGALIVGGGAGASVAQAQEPEQTPAPTEPLPPPTEEPQPPSDPFKSEPSSGLRPASPDGPELDAPAPAAVPAGWQMNYKFVAGTAFHPRASTMTWDYGNTGCTYATADQDEVMAADFQLPDGAIVDFLRIYYYDASAADSTASLTVYDAMGWTEDWFVASSTGTAGFGSVGSGFDEHTVDTMLTPMMLQWRPNDIGNTQMLCGMRLRYWTPPVFGTFMPLIQR